MCLDVGSDVNIGDLPAVVCRTCDCNPCMCGKSDFSSRNEHNRRIQERNDLNGRDPMFIIPDGWGWEA
ncbi:MAG: hypothetical protein WCT16_02860 [Candidatus Buchananbacteria bacterium]